MSAVVETFRPVETVANVETSQQPPQRSGQPKPSPRIDIPSDKAVEVLKNIGVLIVPTSASKLTDEERVALTNFCLHLPISTQLNECRLQFFHLLVAPYFVEPFNETTVTLQQIVKAFNNRYEQHGVKAEEKCMARLLADMFGDSVILVIGAMEVEKVAGNNGVKVRKYPPNLEWIMAFTESLLGRDPAMNKYSTFETLLELAVKKIAEWNREECDETWLLMERFINVLMKDCNQTGWMNSKALIEAAKRHGIEWRGMALKKDQLECLIRKAMDGSQMVQIDGVSVEYAEVPDGCNFLPAVRFVRINPPNDPSKRIAIESGSCNEQSAETGSCLTLTQ